MKISDMIISSIIKKGILYEARNVDLNVDVPTESGKTITINFKAENMKLSIEKEG